MRTKMTQGEMMVWAAVFARECDLRDRPQHLCVPGKHEEMMEWVRGRYVGAIEAAGYAVGALRELRGSRRQEFTGAILNLYDAMMGLAGR